jgi:hypothetical protein
MEQLHLTLLIDPADGSVPPGDIWGEGGESASEWIERVQPSTGFGQLHRSAADISLLQQHI